MPQTSQTGKGDWFMEGAKEAEKSFQARRAAAHAEAQKRSQAIREQRARDDEVLRSRIQVEKRRMKEASRKTPGEVVAAKNMFNAVTGASGVAVDLSPALRKRSFRIDIGDPGDKVSGNPTPDQALAAIEAHVRSADDPFKEAGVWMTKVTQALTAIAQQQLEEQE